MKNVMAILAILLLAVTAGATHIDGCAPYTGTFSRGDSGLTVTVTQVNDKAVAPHVERVANPPADNALLSAGAVRFEGHVDKATGGLFVHWDTVKAAHE